MEAFSLLKFWQIPAGDDATGGGVGRGVSDTNITTSSSGTTDDDEDSFFDLEFNVPGFQEKERSDFKHFHINSSDNDLPKKYGDTASNFVISPKRVPSLESNLKPQSPISFLRSPPKLRVFMLFKKPNIEKTETAGASPATTKHHQQSKRFTVKYKVEEVPIFSLLTRVNSSRSKLQRQCSDGAATSKRFPKEVVRKYLKLIKPLYVRVSRRYNDNLKFSDESSTTATPLSSPVTAPRKQAEEKLGSRAQPFRAVCKHLGKSRSASSAVGIMPSPASRRDDSLVLQHDGIQSAILHCKKSFTSSTEFSVLSRSASDPSCEISVNPSRNSTEVEKKGGSI